MSIISSKSFENTNKFYISVNISEHKEIFGGTLTIDGSTYDVPETVIDTICKKSGIPSTMNKILRLKNKNLWVESNISLYEYYYHSNPVIFLVSNSDVVDVSFKNTLPILNDKFLNTADSVLEDFQSLITIGHYYYDSNSTSSELLIFKSEDYEYKGKTYQLGILFTNDELSAVTCTYAVRVDGITFYLPSKYCSLSSARYLRKSENSIEAFKLLLLRVLEDIETSEWFSIIPTIHNNLDICTRVPATYEDYRKISRLLNRVSVKSDIEDSEIKDILQSLEDGFSDFLLNYPNAEDKNNSYIWRCSALSDNTLYDLLLLTNDILGSHVYYPETFQDIRQSLGDIIMSNKIATELAKRKG